MKTPVITSKDYKVYLEYSFNMSFIHCDCYSWSKEIKLSLLRDFNMLLSIHRQPVYAIHEMNDEKHKKFLSLFKFEYFADFKGNDGITRQLFVRN